MIAAQRRHDAADRDVKTPRTPGLSAFVRCQNEEEYIVASLVSSYRFFDEVLVVLNLSTDRTRELVEDLTRSYPRIRILTYDQPCGPAGDGYLERVTGEPSRSLARYYNWCLEQTKFSHVCKWDGDMIALPSLSKAREKMCNHDVVMFDGYDLLDQYTTDMEARVFRYDPEHTRYVDWDLYEVLNHDYSNIGQVDEKCFLHMKLGKREWLHKEWTCPNILATNPVPPPGRGWIGLSTAERLRRWLNSAKNWIKKRRRTAS